ncbi:MAG: N-6 DNA methylase [Rhodospirillales bacterium]|nr:N-6 DNA methylase [Rhodospirillales bacterium]
MVDDTDWVSLDADVKGDLYEGLLEKNAEDTKSGAGQYFTPRALIRAMVECVRPEPGRLIADPACGTGGFFLAAYDFIASPDNFPLEKPQKEFLKHQAFHGNEIVANTRRALGRAVTAFSSHIDEKKQKPANAGQPWAAEEDAQLLKEFDRGATISELAATHE